MPVLLLPDAGPLITLAYADADALDLLLTPGWSVHIVDMVLHEVTRSATPTSAAIGNWVTAHSLPIVPTNTMQYHLQQLAAPFWKRPERFPRPWLSSAMRFRTAGIFRACVFRQDEPGAPLTG